MNINEFSIIYSDLITESNINERKIIKYIFSAVRLQLGIGLGALAYNKSNTNINDTKSIEQTEVPPVEEPTFTPIKKNIIIPASWIDDITIPFIIKFEGSIKDNNGMHVLYDDDVTQTEKRRWNR